MKKTKAQREYEKLRSSLIKTRSRLTKSGSALYFDLPATLKQQLKGTGKTAKASDYREAIKELKQLKSLIRDYKREEKTKPKVDYVQPEIPDASQVIIDNFLNDLPEGEGSVIITREVARAVDKYGAKTVAQTLDQMQQDGILITRAELYNPEYAFRFLGEMHNYLVGNSIITEEQFQEFEDALYMEYGEAVPEELQS